MLFSDWYIHRKREQIKEAERETEAKAVLRFENVLKEFLDEDQIQEVVAACQALDKHGNASE